MIITIKKFGLVLISRQAGKEARAAFLPTLSSITNNDEVVVDFEGVTTFSPSWGDEFLTPLQKEYGERLQLKNSHNPSVLLTIKILERVNGVAFKII